MVFPWHGTEQFGECPLYFGALQNSQNVFKVFILTVTIRSPQVQLSDTRTVTKTARKSTRSYSFIAHSLATQEFPVIVDFIYWLSLHSCQSAHVLFVTQYDNNTFPTAVEDVPVEGNCFFLAHEFFDALPVHQFQVCLYVSLS